MSENRSILVSLGIRLLIASPFLILTFTGRAFVMTPVCALIAAVILAQPVARLLAEPFGKLFWSAAEFDRPQPMYSISAAKRKKGLYEEAMAGFEEIARKYPRELKPYIDMIDIAIVDLHDGERANAIYQRGIARLKRTEDKEALAKMYRAIRSRLDRRSRK